MKGNHFVTCHFCLDSVQEIMLSSHFYSCHSENLELLCEICFKVYKGKSELFPSKTALLIHRNKNPRNHPQHREFSTKNCEQFCKLIIYSIDYIIEKKNNNFLQGRAVLKWPSVSIVRRNLSTQKERSTLWIIWFGSTVFHRRTLDFPFKKRPS